MILSKKQMADIVKSELGEAVEGILQRIVRSGEVAKAMIVVEQMGEQGDKKACDRLITAMQAFLDKTTAPEKKSVDALADRIAAAIERAESEADSESDEAGDEDLDDLDALDAGGRDFDDDDDDDDMDPDDGWDLDDDDDDDGT